MASDKQLSLFANKPNMDTAPPQHTHTKKVHTWLESVYEELVQGLRSYFRKNHFHRGVVGVSGGVDSALTLKIAVDAVGSENVTALLMPEHGVSNDENIYHARGLCEFLRVKFFIQPINNFFPEYTLLPWKPNRIALMNTKARIRAALLYSYANSETALVLGTSNKSEILLGYGTKYGDLAADIEVIGDLFKTEVIKLSDHIGMPPEITFKRPSAELAPGQSDEEELGAPYPDLDKVLMKRDLGAEGCVLYGLPLALVQLVFRRMAENEHKTKMPPVLSIKRN